MPRGMTTDQRHPQLEERTDPILSATFNQMDQFGLRFDPLEQGLARIERRIEALARQLAVPKRDGRA